MDEQAAFKQMEEWGYYMVPRRQSSNFGSNALLVAIREKPTGQHFDPESIQVELCDTETGLDELILTLHNTLSRPRHVCPGTVVLTDRVGKRVDFFIFGGSLEAVAKRGETVYSLTSPAPILELLGQVDSPAEQLAVDVKARLAELRAGWGLEETGFTRCLAGQDPFQFYLASLQSVLKRYERVPSLRQFHRDFHTILQREKEDLRQASQWPAAIPTLAELLAPE